MHRLVRITSNDYRDFRRIFSQIRFSVLTKDTKRFLVPQYILDMEIPKMKIKFQFLEEVNDPQRELYFFEVDGERKGYVQLVFYGVQCDIFEFAVLEHGKGLGTILFNEALELIKGHSNVKMIRLWCPYPGAQLFWQKVGFMTKYKNQALYFEKKL